MSGDVAACVISEALASGGVVPTVSSATETFPRDVSKTEQEEDFRCAAADIAYTVAVPITRLRRRHRKNQKLPRPEWAKHADNPISDDELMESWTSALRRTAEDAYYRRVTWEALATVFVALVFGLAVAWWLSH
jgi:glycosyltransferase involved in cell wall biosynthesis